MDFVTAEEKFNELQARIRRGEPMSEDQYQEELAKLMVQDEAGVFWSLEPGTGRWLYFNGTEWVPGMPPAPSVPPPATPLTTSPVMETPSTYEPYAAQSPAYQEPVAGTPPSATEAPSYYVQSDVTRPIDYSSAYSGSTSAYDDSPAGSAYVPLPGDSPQLESEGMPTYVRMAESDAANTPTGGIPPRPVREASPLAVPGGERAWLPFAFGALVLLLCAVVLFFGVRGLPQFSGAPVVEDPTEEPSPEETDVLPTATVRLLPTDAPRPTEAATEVPQPTPAPAAVTAAATDVLNIRQGPDRTTPSLGKLQPQQTVPVVGRNSEGTWLQIQRPDGQGLGWVSAEFVNVTGDVNTLPVISGDGASNPAPQATETPTG